ncbi:MAG: hypothetical protein KA118_16105 [Verrucomicrobia bacterium]|nr:hypothetical protein [Verrucomicrobiota bacterium]
MNRRMRQFLILLSALSMAGMGLAQTAPAAPPAGLPAPATRLTTADQVLRANLEAIGGEATLRKITSRAMKGDLDLPAAGGRLRWECVAKSPNKRLITIDMPGYGLVREGFDGQTAWTWAPDGGIQLKTGESLARTRRDAEFHPELKWPELFPAITLQGIQPVGGRDAYALLAQPPSGNPEKLYFDVQTLLLVRRDSETDSPSGKVPIEMYYEDYRPVDGTQVPFRIRMPTPAIAQFTLTLTECRHNVSIGNSRFDQPRK